LKSISENFIRTKEEANNEKKLVIEKPV